jgi:uncharacterized protein (DUF2249 family)
MNRDIINPQMKVHELLEQYPELEDELIAITPAFKKLKHPVLRKTIARVATLQQAALVGEVPVQELINRLRTAAGQTVEHAGAVGTLVMTHDEDEPAWLRSAMERREFDARPMLESGAHPLQEVFQRLRDLPDGCVLDLITPFQPQPLIEAVRAQGWSAWSRKLAPDTVVTSIGKEGAE